MSGDMIRVVVRCRDLLRKELESGQKQAVRIDAESQQVIVSPPGGDPDTYSFDAVFNNTFTQKHIFTQEVQPLCDALLQGYNATVFAYGQSGSGKTFTMTGDLQGNDPAQHGMMPQSVEYIFNEIRQQTTPTRTFKVKVQYVELYNGEVCCLLSLTQEKLKIKQNEANSFYADGAASLEVADWKECMDQFNAGTDRRCSRSRSHSLFTLTLESYDTENDSSSPVVMTSKINIVDLAGCERMSQTGASGDALKEGAAIGLALSTLSAVLDGIVRRKEPVPYRGSPLTMLLKETLGGNSKTVMFATCAPSEVDAFETISTLRVARRVCNKP